MGAAFASILIEVEGKPSERDEVILVNINCLQQIEAVLEKGLKLAVKPNIGPIDYPTMARSIETRILKKEQNSPIAS